MGDDDKGVIVDGDHFGLVDDDDEDEEEEKEDNDVGNDVTILPRTMTRVETRMKGSPEGGRGRGTGCSDTRCTEDREWETFGARERF
jgi:hypothetical protein